MKLPKIKFVDLSIPIKNPCLGEMDAKLATSLAAEINYLDHEDTSDLVRKYFGCNKEDLLDGKGWGTERIKTSSHAGTHVDAPYHYFPVCDGEPSKTISDLPLEWFLGHGVVLDMTHIKDGETVKQKDVEGALKKINHKLEYGDIVCIRFDTDKKFGTPEYWTRYPGLSGEAVRYILDFGVKVIGVDSPGLDIPFADTKKLFAESKDTSILWEAHRAGKDYNYAHIEKLANLDKLPETGFIISCFPVNIHNSSAGWTRATGMLFEK